MPKEIERRFLIRELPPSLVLHRPVWRQQAYTLIDQVAGQEERIRYQRGPNGLVTFLHDLKTGLGRERMESSSPMSATEYTAALATCLGDPLTKRIYNEQWANRWFELKIFLSHPPLVLVEFEFGMSEAAERFRPFSWLGPEVTEDRRYDSAAIACWGIPGEYRLDPSLVRRFWPPAS